MANIKKRRHIRESYKKFIQAGKSQRRKQMQGKKSGHHCCK